jgi:glycosyltransferase involved in cell wall biosynthesis
MKLSVIVCTRNRAYSILLCLGSIEQALLNAAPLDAEIIVIDNGSEDNTSAIVQEWATSCAFPVRLVFEPRKGLAVARNCALRTAQGDLLAWTDDDCRLSKDYVVTLLRHDARNTELTLYAGRVELGDPTDLPLTVKTSPTPAQWSRKINSARHEGLVNCVVGCNMAMRRTLVDKLGFYDERFGVGTSLLAGEDTDYTFRAYLAGIVIEYVPDLVVFHYHGRKTPSAGYKLIRNYTISLGAIYAKFLFKDYNLCRLGYWDLRHAIQEVITGKNKFMPEINFSYKRMMIYCLMGAVRFIAISAKMQIMDL